MPIRDGQPERFYPIESDIPMPEFPRRGRPRNKRTFNNDALAEAGAHAVNIGRYATPEMAAQALEPNFLSNGSRKSRVSMLAKLIRIKRAEINGSTKV